MDSIDQLRVADFINELASSIETYSRQLSLSNASPSSSNSIDVAHAPSTLLHLVNSESMDHFGIFKIWTPDVWTLLLFFLICVGVKLAYTVGLNKGAVKRTQAALTEKLGHEVEIEVARSVLKKPLSYVSVPIR